MVISPRLPLATLTVVLILATAAPARAQGFINGTFGFNFGGASGCPQLTGCTNQQRTFAIGAGKFGTIFGAETEIAYSPKFFGDAPGLSSNVLTVMGNVMFGPKAGPVRPYITLGTGIMKTHFKLSRATVLTTNDTALGYNVGGGVFVLFGDRFGLRADARFFRSFPDVTIVGITLAQPHDQLNYSRVSGAVVIAF